MQGDVGEDWRANARAASNMAGEPISHVVAGNFVEQSPDGTRLEMPPMNCKPPARIGAADQWRHIRSRACADDRITQSPLHLSKRRHGSHLAQAPGP